MVAENDSRVPDVSNVDASATNESDAGRGARGAWQTARRAGPRFCNRPNKLESGWRWTKGGTLTDDAPHGVVGGEEAVRDSAQNVLVALRPKVFLLHDEVHEIFLGELGRLATAVAVEDAEVGVLEILFVWRRLVGHRENVLHVLAATLVAVAGDAQIDADARRHLDSLVDAAPHQNRKQNKDTLDAQHCNTAMSLRH